MPYRPDQDQRTWSEIVRPAIRIVSLDGREIFILLVYTIALGLVAAAVPLASQILVNQAAFTGAAPPILALSVIVLGVLLIGTFIRLFQIRVAALIAKRTFVRSAIEGTRALLDSPSQAYEFDDREVANRFFDVMTFQVAFSVLASEVLGVLVVSLVGIAILAFYHPLFFSFSIVVALTCMLIIGFSAKQGVKRGTKRSSEKYRVAFWLSQIAENRSMLRQSDNNRIVHSMTDELSTEYVRSYFDYLRVLLWQSGALFLIQAFASAAFFGVGGWLVINGQLSLGQLVAAEIIVLSNMAALTRFYFYLDSFYETVVAASKISQLTEADAGEPTRAAASKSAKIRGLTLNSGMLWEPLELKSGDVIALRGPSRRNCSVFLQRIAASDRFDDVTLKWNSDASISRESAPDQVLFLARPAVLRMTLAENLSLLSDADTLNAARSTVLDNPLLRPSEQTDADHVLNDVEMSISDRARYAVARTFMSNRPVVLIDMFFNLMEADDQITFIREFKTRFPDRILMINSFDTAIDPYITRAVKIRGTDA